jgi:hypothetical protein
MQRRRAPHTSPSQYAQRTWVYLGDQVGPQPRLPAPCGGLFCCPQIETACHAESARKGAFPIVGTYPYCQVVRNRRCWVCNRNGDGSQETVSVLGTDVPRTTARHKITAQMAAAGIDLQFISQIASELAAEALIQAREASYPALRCKRTFAGDRSRHHERAH